MRSPRTATPLKLLRRWLVHYGAAARSHWVCASVDCAEISRGQLASWQLRTRSSSWQSGTFPASAWRADGQHRGECCPQKGHESIREFFAHKAAGTARQADLKKVVASATAARALRLSVSFVVGISILLKNTGVVTFEFPHLLNLIAHNQFDTVYHEHYSYTVPHRRKRHPRK